MSYRLALAGLYILLVATVAAVMLCKLNPAIISAVAIPFVTLARARLARRRVQRQGDRGPSSDEHSNVERSESE